MKNSGLFAPLAGALLLAAAAAPAAAYDDRIQYIHARAEGLFFTVSAESLKDSGDLRRDLTLWHIQKAFLIPRLEHGLVLDLGVGIGRKNAYGSWEIRYSLALPGAGVGERTGTLQDHNLEIIGRSFLIHSQVFHPYGLLGIDLSLLRIRNGSFFEGNFLTASYAGGGVDAGAGAILDLGPRAFLNIEALYRFTVFLYAYGEGKGRDINYMHVGTQDGPVFGRLLRSSRFGLSVSLGFML
jgi:hypothetical protein